jgi:NitT/TauT family transport system substrate-binding protein
MIAELRDRHRRTEGWMKRSRRVLALLAAVLVSASAGPLQAAEPLNVVIGVSSRSWNPGFSNMWVGIPVGLFAPSLAVEAVGTQGAAENLQFLLANQVTVGTGVQDVVFQAMAEGRALPVVAPCVYMRGLIFRMVTKPESPLKTFQDLAGKRVGVASLAAGVAHYVRFAAEAAGIDPNAIELIAVGDGQQAAVALSSGRIDALASYDVDLFRIESLGIKLRYLDQPAALKDAAVGYVFAFHKNFYNSHKDAVVEILRGQIKAVILMLENPEAAVRISYHMYPEAVPAGVPFEKAVAEAVATVKVRAPAIEKNVGTAHNWCEFPAKTWEQYVAMIGLKGKVDPMKFYTDELIARVNDFDEGAFRAWARTLKVPQGDAEYRTWLAALKAPQ